MPLLVSWHYPKIRDCEQRKCTGFGSLQRDKEETNLPHNESERETRQTHDEMAYNGWSRIPPPPLTTRPNSLKFDPVPLYKGRSPPPPPRITSHLQAFISLAEPEIVIGFL